MTRLAALLTSLLILTPPAQMAAQTPAKQVEGFSLASEVARADLPAMAALKARGARVVGLINVERLPQDAWMAELEIETPRKQRARLPIKLLREAKTRAWRIVWTPAPEYVEALLAITAVLPRDELGAAAWSQGGRMPALPIIATRQRLITPLGAMTWDTGELPNNMPSSVKDLAPPALLVTHIQRWFGGVLEGEPGAASLDLLAEPGLDWRSVQKILLAAGSQGAFVLHVICAGEGSALVAAPLMAPVFGNVPEPDRPRPLTVTLLEPVGAQMKARVSYQGKVITDQPTFLIDSPQALAAQLTPLIAAAIPQPGPRHLFFGAPGDMALQEVLRWLAPLPTAAQVAPSKIFVGYVRKD
jgi:hypothetical protein